MANSIKVTNVQVFPFKESPAIGRIRGIAMVEINGAIRICSLRIMSGENGLFVGYPVDPFYKGEEYRYVVNCITEEAKKAIETAVLDKYRELAD